MKTPKLLLTVSSLLWKRKRRRENFPESTTWSVIRILLEHLLGLPWYEFWFSFRLMLVGVFEFWVLVALVVFAWQDGSKAVFNAKPTSVSRDTLIKPHKVHRGPTKKIAWDHGILPSSKDEILELLHDFVNQFLSGGGYNGMLRLEWKMISLYWFSFYFVFCSISCCFYHINVFHTCISFNAVAPRGYWKGAPLGTTEWCNCLLSGCSVCHFFSVLQVFDL